MELIADGVLILAALAAMAYCMVLSRRLRRLTELDGGLGAAISALSREVDHLSGALAEAKTATTDSATDLGAQCRAAHVAARRLETLVKSANKTVFSKVAVPSPAGKTPQRESAAKVGSGETDPVEKPPKHVNVQDEPTLPNLTAATDSDVVTAEKVAPSKPPKIRKVPSAVPTPTPIDVKPSDSLDATALDEFIGAIIAKGDAEDNAALARRLVMALAGQDGARAS